MSDVLFPLDPAQEASATQNPSPGVEGQSAVHSRTAQSAGPAQSFGSTGDEAGGASLSGSPAFDRLRQELMVNERLRLEVEHAFYTLVGAANPSDRGLRFLYGNGAEWIMAAAAWSAGVLTAPKGHNADGFDLVNLLGDARGLWSVKASAAPNASQIRLKNFMGTGEGASWDEPTLFISPYLGGAVLVDPRIHHDIASLAAWKGDALAVGSAAVKRFSERRPENLVRFNVAINDTRKKPDPAAFAKTILVADSFPLLSAPFRAAQPAKGQRSLSEELEALQTLRQAGALDEQQYQHAVDAVLAGNRAQNR